MGRGSDSQVGSGSGFTYHLPLGAARLSTTQGAGHSLWLPLSEGVGWLVPEAALHAGLRALPQPLGCLIPKGSGWPEDWENAALPGRPREGLGNLHQIWRQLGNQSKGLGKISSGQGTAPFLPTFIQIVVSPQNKLGANI